jgi:replicative DNA helicase
MRLPQSIESEKRVLGALLLDSSLLKNISNELCPEDFTKTLHKEIFNQMRKLAIVHKGFDAQMICDALKLNKAGEKYLYELANDTASTANIKAYADIIREKSVQRQLIAVATDIAKAASKPGNEGIRELLDEAENKVRSIYDNGACGFQSHLASFFKEIVEEIESIPRDEFDVGYIQYTIIEVNKALVDTLRHVEDTHPKHEED